MTQPPRLSSSPDRGGQNPAPGSPREGVSDGHRANWPPAVEARGIRKSFRHAEVLRGVDLSVRPGSLVAVVGENGAGKSTLLKILAGSLQADGGTVLLGGALGYCPQEPVLNDSLTVGQHLEYFAAAYRLRSLRRADELIGILRFDRYRDEQVGHLSGGTRQKLNLTLALMHDPAVLLLDEPYQGFDWETYLRFWDVVQDLRARSRAIVVISHLVFEESRFDALLDLVDGRIQPRTPEHREAVGGGG